MRRVAHGAPARCCGLPRVPGPDARHRSRPRSRAVYGWDGDGPRARIAPAARSTASPPRCAACSRSRASGGRIAFATARPASLLRALPPAGGARRGRRGRGARGRGDRRLRPAGPAGAVDRPGRRAHRRRRAPRRRQRRSRRGVAVHAGPPRPRRRRPRRTPAWRRRAGFEVVAFADLDAVALAVAAWQGRAVRVVPLDDRRPPAAYAPLLELIEVASPRTPSTRSPALEHRPRETEPVAALLQHGPQRPTLTPRRSGGNGRGEPVAQSFATARFLTVQEVADLMRVSTMTVYRIIKSGELPAVRVGRSFRVRDVDVDTYLGKRYTQAG